MIIFDIGASTGPYTTKWAQQHIDAQIYAFEPNPTSFQTLSSVSQPYPNILLYNKGISNTDGKKCFYEANYTNSSSLLPFNEEGTKKWRNPSPAVPPLKTINTYEVECIRLDNFIKKNNIDTIDFMKIDTQGHDLAVIKSLGEHIYKVKEIAAEIQVIDYELYKDAATKKDMINYMKEKGFSIYYIQPWSHHQEENIWFTNNRFKDFLHLN